MNADRRYEVAFGHDRICGWYVQVWDKSVSVAMHPYDTPLLDLDEGPATSGDCNRALLKTVGNTYGVEITDADLDAAVAESPRGSSPYQGFLEHLGAHLGMGDE